jgi:hypothetical protein
MSQFRKADSSVYTTFLDMIEKVFPKLSSYSFGLLYREKMKKSKGGLILAEICQPTKLLSYFAKNDSGNPFDFLIIVDEMAWCCAKADDRIRIIRHELRHIDISDKGVARLIGHDFQDFYAECDLNADSPTWAQKLVEIVLAGYGQVKDGQKDPRTETQEGVTEMTKDPQRQTKLPEDVKEKAAVDTTEVRIDKGETVTDIHSGKTAADVVMEGLEPESLDPGDGSATAKADKMAESRGLKKSPVVDPETVASNISLANLNAKARASDREKARSFA